MLDLCDHRSMGFEMALEVEVSVEASLTEVTGEALDPSVDLYVLV
jgi:hypothetical protein